MPDFFSRLVERTFGLATVAQPVTQSLFSPVSLIKSDFIQDLAHDNESSSNKESAYIDSTGKTGIIPQNNGQSLFNLKKPSNENNVKPPVQIEHMENQNYFASRSRQLHNIDSIKQDDSNLQKQIRSVHVQQRNEQHNQFLDTQSDEVVQNKKHLYKANSDTLEPVEPELLYMNNRNDRSTLRMTPNSTHHKEQTRDGERDFEGHLEPFVDSVENLSGKMVMDLIPDSSLISGSSSSPNRNEPILQNRDPASRVGFSPHSDLHFDALSPQIIPGRKNLKRTGIQKINTSLEQMSNMSIGQYAAVSRSPSTTPTIKVTIGRIEVRAVKPPQEPQPQTPPPRQHPILSLDDYLKQYNG